jgi:hypothetical protein
MAVAAQHMDDQISLSCIRTDVFGREGTQIHGTFAKVARDDIDVGEESDQNQGKHHTTPISTLKTYNRSIRTATARLPTPRPVTFGAVAPLDLGGCDTCRAPKSSSTSYTVITFHHYEGILITILCAVQSLICWQICLVLHLAQLLLGVVATRVAGHALLRHWILVALLLLLEIALVVEGRLGGHVGLGDGVVGGRHSAWLSRGHLGVVVFGRLDLVVCVDAVRIAARRLGGI